MEGIKQVAFLALVLCVTGIIIGVSMISLGQFAKNGVDRCYNSTFEITANRSDNYCSNSTPYEGNPLGWENRNLSQAYEAIVQAKTGITTISEQQSTVGIVAVMTVIIGLLASVFAYFAWFK